MRRLLLLCLFLLVAPASATLPPVLPAEIQARLPGLALRGSGSFSVLWMDIYTATLWTSASPRSLALALRYSRELDGEAIARRSREEIESLGLGDENALAEWEARMKALFPDVGPGDQLTGVLLPDGRTAFYFGEQLLDVIDDPRFGDAFFAIWLHEETSAPDLRRALLGEPPES